VMPLGSHDMFLAEVVGIYVDGHYMDQKNTFHLEKADLITYSHGQYYVLGKPLGSFGYSIRKSRRKKNKKTEQKTSGQKANKK
jgi:hypothetical protein